MLTMMLLAVSTLLTRQQPNLAIAGFAIAVVGMGLRNVLVQTSSFEERDRLDRLARFDALTGLANRRQFDQVLRTEWNRARRSGKGMVLLMIDVDHFKALNDTFGHPIGDQRLREVGKAIAGHAMRESDLVARYGGEEFAAILPTTGVAEACMLAESMRATVAQLQLASPVEDGFVTISIGIGYVERIAASEPYDLLKTADDALYAAKAGGRNRVACHFLAVAA